MKRFLATLCCLVVLAVAAFSSGRAQPPEVRTLMRMKLTHAQGILEGISIEDFDKIAKVTSVHETVDGDQHVGVVLEDDPAADLHEWYGRYLYFAPDEIEPLSERNTSCKQ